MLPALKQLLQIAKVIAKNSCHKAEKVNELSVVKFLCKYFSVLLSNLMQSFII